MYNLCLTLFVAMPFVQAEVQVTPVSDEAFPYLNSPVWHDATQSVYFTDNVATNYTIGRFDYRTKQFFVAKVNETAKPSFIAPIENAVDQFIVSFGLDVKRVQWDGKSPSADVIDTILTAETDPFYATNSMHYGKVDPNNRLYFGTIRKLRCNSDPSGPSGSFYVYTKEKGIQQIVGNVNIPGGMGWNLEQKKFYAVSTCPKDILQFSYTDDGTYYDEEQLFHIPAPPNTRGAVADMATDINGHLWVISFNGSLVYQLDAENRSTLSQVEFPTEILTGLVFGGPDLSTLFVTTALEASQTVPFAGKLYQVTGLGTTGAASGEFKL